MNVKHPHVGPLSQPSQALTLDARRAWQTGTANNSCQYMTVNTGVQAPQQAQIGFHNGANSHGQMSNWQTVAVPHQVVSSQQNQQQSCLIFFTTPSQSKNGQSKNTSLPNANGFTVPNEHNFYQNKNSTSHTHPNTRIENPQEHNWNQLITTEGKRRLEFEDGNVVSAEQIHKAKKPIYLNGTWTVATPHNRTLMPDTALHKQAANNQNQAHNVTQNGSSPSALPNYSMAVAQSARRSSTNSSSRQYNNFTLQKIRQHSHLYSLLNDNVAANSSNNMNSYKYCQGYPDEKAMMITKIKSDLYKGYPVGSDGRQAVQTSSPLISTVDKSVNSSATQRLQCHPAQSFANSVSSGMQHNVNTHGQQSSVPSVCYRATGYESGNGSNGSSTFFPKDGNLGSSNDASHVLQLPGSISSQKTTVPSSVVRDWENLSFATQNDSSIHPSPGQMGAKAVAVVPPLSQESYQGTRVQTFCNDFDKSIATDVVSCNLQTSPPPTLTSEVTVTQKCDMDKCEMPEDPTASVTDLSSLPTVPWTVAMLTKLIENSKSAQVGSEKTQCSRAIMETFWKDSMKTFIFLLRSNYYRNLMADINKFCSEHLTLNTVILSEVKQNCQELLKSYHVLKDKEVYSEPPYRSSWLNLNQQLDDIDREFGPAWSLRPHLCTPESKSQSKIETPSAIPSQHASEESNTASSQVELKPRDTSEENQASTVESLSPPRLSPDKRDSADSSDPYYSFEIKVLPPEEAKIIFEQIPHMPQSMDTDSQPEKVAEKSVEVEPPDFEEKVVKFAVEDELHDNSEVTQSDSELQIKEVSSVEQVCCLAHWLGNVLGSETHLKCNCKKDQSQSDCAEKILNAQETKVCTNNSNSDSNDLGVHFDLTKDDETPNSPLDKISIISSPVSKDGSHSSVILISDSEDENLPSSQGESPSQIGDFGSEEDCLQEKAHVAASDESNNSDNSKKECEDVCLNDKPVSQMLTPEEDCVSVSQQNSDMAQITLTTKEQSQSTDMAGLPTTAGLSKHETTEERKRRLSSDDKTLPYSKKLKVCRPPFNQDAEPVLRNVKCTEASVSATDEKPSDSNIKTANLVLFGTKSQASCSLAGNTKHCSSSLMSVVLNRPPDTISVSLSPLKPKSIDPPSESSVKRRIHDTWKKSYLPIEVKRRGKFKKERSLKKADRTDVSSKSDNRAHAEDKTPIRSVKWRKGATWCPKMIIMPTLKISPLAKVSNGKKE